MKKVKMTLAMILSICLLTACSKARTTDTSILDDAFTEETPKVSDEVIEAMDRYEDMVNKYCEFLEVYNSADMDTQLKFMGKYSEFADTFGEYQAKMEELLDHEEKFSETDYAYVQGVYVRCTEKVFDAAGTGFNYSEENTNE